MKDIITAVEKYKTLILDAERYIWQHPETGYKEIKTSAYMETVFRDLGYELVTADGITGFYTVVDTGKPGPEILVLAELDAVICPEHKDADPVTGAVHACGHNTQCAALIGIAATLKEPGILNKFCGSICDSFFWLRSCLGFWACCMLCPRTENGRQSQFCPALPLL